MFAYRFERMAEANDNVLKNNLQANNIESMLAHFANQNSPVLTPQRNHEAISVPLNAKNVMGQRGY